MSVSVRHARFPGLARSLDGAQFFLAGLGLVFCSSGDSGPLGWLLLPVGFAVVRAVWDGAFRGRLFRLWESLTHFRRGGPLPWRGALLFVCLPALLLLLTSNRTLGTGDTWPVVPT